MGWIFYPYHIYNPKALIISLKSLSHLVFELYSFCFHFDEWWAWKKTDSLRSVSAFLINAQSRKSKNVNLTTILGSRSKKKVLFLIKRMSSKKMFEKPILHCFIKVRSRVASSNTSFFIFWLYYFSYTLLWFWGIVVSWMVKARNFGTF